MKDRRPGLAAIALTPGAAGAAIAFWGDPLSALGASVVLTAALVVLISSPGMTAGGSIILLAAAASILITTFYPRPADSSAGVVAVAEALGLLMLVAAATRLPKAWHAIVGGVAATAATSVLILRLAEVSSPAHAVGMSLFGAVFAGVVAATGAAVRRQGQAWRRRDEQRRRTQREELAKDLHDYLGHDLTAVLVQAQAALTVGTGSRISYHDTLMSIEADAARALTTLDRVVATLFGSSEIAANAVPPEAAARPTPGLDDLPALVQRFNATGTTPTQLDVDPVLDTTVDPEIGTAIFRLVAEALTNIRRHAPAATSATVTLRNDRSDLAGSVLVVEVTNESVAGTERSALRARSGVGLAGMRERIELLAGTVEAGFLSSTRWQVQARFPQGDHRG